MHTSTESEVRSGKIAAVVSAEHTKLKYRDQRDFHLASHVHRRARWPRGNDLHLHGNNLRTESLVRTRADRVPCARGVSIDIEGISNRLVVAHPTHHGGTGWEVDQILNLGVRGTLELGVQRRQVRSEFLHSRFGAVVREIILQVVAAHAGLV